MSFELGFHPSALEEEQMLSGKVVKLRPDSAILTITDGSFNKTLSDLELRCPGMGLISCNITKIGDYRKCESYDIKFTDRCTFRSKLLLYSFSDHKKAQLDMAGELEIRELGNSDLKFIKVSWLDIN